MKRIFHWQVISLVATAMMALIMLLRVPILPWSLIAIAGAMVAASAVGFPYSMLKTVKQTKDVARAVSWTTPLSQSDCR